MKAIVKEIVAAYLKANKYDGLWNAMGDCGCPLDDLDPAPCLCGTCRPAYKCKMEDGEDGFGPVADGKEGG